MPRPETSCGTTWPVVGGPLRRPEAGNRQAATAVAPGRYGFVKPEHAEFPPILIIAVTNVCDMACIHCAHPVI